MRRFSPPASAGVTLIELMVVLTIMSLVIISIVTLLGKTVGDAQRTGAQAVFDSRMGFAFNRIERDVRLASSFNTSVAAPFTDPYAPGAGWSNAGGGENERVLILNLPSTVARDRATSQILTYQDSATYNCSSQLRLNPIHSFRVLYFVENETLYKRFLTDTTTPLCNTQIQKQSCPTANIATWPGVCRAPDETIAENVVGFSVEYANGGDAQALSDAYSSPELVANARAAVITLTLESGDGPSSARASATLRIARVN